MISFGFRYAMLSRATQLVTLWAGHPVARYPSISAMASSVARLVYRADTLDSALAAAMMPLKISGRPVDFLRHPSLTQRNLDWLDSVNGPPPEGRMLDAGDCEDFSAYFAAALIRSELADPGTVRLVYVSWQDKAHMVCEAARNGEPFWISNWFRCMPRAGAAIPGMRSQVGPLREAWAWDVALTDADTVILRNAARIV